MNNKLFGEQLLKYRNDHGLTAEFVAKKIGTSRSTYYRWECGETSPNVLFLWRLCDLYSADPTSLMYWTPPDNPTYLDKDDGSEHGERERRESPF